MNNQVFLVLQALGEKMPLISIWTSFATLMVYFNVGDVSKGQSYPRLITYYVCRKTDFGLHLLLQSIKQSAKMASRAKPFYDWGCDILMKPRFDQSLRTLSLFDLIQCNDTMLLFLFVAILVKTCNSFVSIPSNTEATEGALGMW